MNYFQQLQKFLDQGIKLSDQNCPDCNKLMMFNGANNSLYCIKCDQEIPIKNEDEIEELDQYEYNDEQSRQNSKNLGDYLLSGWTMLGEHCDRCIIPLMRKGDETICIKCNNEKNNSDQQNKNQEKNQAPNNQPQNVKDKQENTINQMQLQKNETQKVQQNQNDQQKQVPQINFQTEKNCQQDQQLNDLEIQQLEQLLKKEKLKSQIEIQKSIQKISRTFQNLTEQSLQIDHNSIVGQKQLETYQKISTHLINQLNSLNNQEQLKTIKQHFNQQI